MPTPRPELPSLDETRIFSRPVELPPDFAVLEPPVLIGPDRYRVKIQASGRESIYYYSGTPDQLPLFDQVVWFRWQDLYLPLLNQQDFRWAGLPMPGFTDPMTGEPVKLGRQTCGQAITASLVSITDEISPEPEVTPDQIHQTYFSDRKLLGTVITDHVPIWEQAGYTVDQILSIPAIDESIDNNKVVVVQGFFNFHWWDESDRLVEHFVLVLDKDTNNQLVIWDPIWGFGVTKIKDLDLGRPHAMYALTFPEP